MKNNLAWKKEKGKKKTYLTVFPPAISVVSKEFGLENDMVTNFYMHCMFSSSIYHQKRFYF